MTTEIIFIFFLIICVFAAFIWEKFPPNVVALGASAILLATGILETSEFLGAFSNSAVITIAMMFIVSAALERTGVLQIVSRFLKKAAKGSYLRLMLTMMFCVALASAFMNNTPIVILMTPIVISLASGINVAPSRLLIPLSFSAIFGGTLTLIGTSTNILIGSVAMENGEPAIGMFEMTLPGLIFGAIGTVYMIFAGRFLLADRYSVSSLISEQPRKQFISEVLVRHDSQYIGKSIAEIKEAAQKEDITILDIRRGDETLRRRKDNFLVEAGDRVTIEANAGSLVGLKENGVLSINNADVGYEAIRSAKNVVVEASIGPKSALIGGKISKLGLARKYGVYVIAVHRDDKNISHDFENINLRFADVLLLEGTAESIKRLLDEGDVINLSEAEEKPIRRQKAPIAMAVLLMVMLLAAIGIMPIAGLAVIGAVIVMAAGCVDAEEAYDAIDWPILFLIVGMLGLSMGMEKTGAAEVIVKAFVSLLQGVGPLAILFAIYILTSALTEMVSNNAVAVLIGPIVIGLAHELGFDARPFIMAVLFAASASFATPIGYQTNTFVYGAGGYHFKDFIKVGLPLNIIFATLAVAIIPLFFPF